jgi:hypothetical protein
MEPYYQHANRLAVLHFLTSRRVDAHLVDVFFVGRTDADDRSPGTAGQWAVAVDARRRHLGLTGLSPLEAHVHEVFVDVSGRQPRK